MNRKGIFARGRGIAALALILALLAGFWPVMTEAAPAQGDQATTDYRTVLVGSDGGHFFLTGTEISIGYRQDGGIFYFEHENYSGPRMHYRIEVPGEGAWWGYCIEHGLSFPDAQTYTGMNSENDRYFLNLPESARTGILLASLYGRQPGRPVPVSGCNEDDWYWATQVVIWEYQQLLRTGPDTLKSNGHVPAGYFRATLAGRPAEKCYDYILDRIREHGRIPSFTTKDAAGYPVFDLSRSGNQGDYTLNLTDTNQTGIVLDPGNVPVGIVYQGGGDYAFRAGQSGTETILVFKRLVPMPAHELLVWGSGSDHQALITGTKDPVSFGMVVRTPGQGQLIVQKTSEDGRIRDIGFRLTGPAGEVFEGRTDDGGAWRISLDPGAYLLEELPVAGYVPVPAQRIEVKENQSIEISVSNELERRPLLLVKTDGETGKPVPMAGALFRIAGAVYATDNRGIITIPDGLPFGAYTVEELASPTGYALPEMPVFFTVDDRTGETVSIAFPDVPQKGRIHVHKTGLIPGTSHKYQNLEGAELVLLAAEDITTPDGSLRLAKGETAGTLVTDKDGMAVSGLLYPGKYRILETKSPTGYKLPSAPVAMVVVPADDSGREVIDVELSLDNEPLEEAPNTGDSGADPLGLALRAGVTLFVILFAVLGRPRKHPLG